MEDFTECDKFADFDVRSICFKFCVGAFGNFDSHKL